MGRDKKQRVAMLILGEVVRDGKILRTAQSLSECCDLTILGIDRGKYPLDHIAERKKLGLNISWATLSCSKHLPMNTIGYGARYAEVALKLICKGIALRPKILHACGSSALPIALAIRRVTGARIIYDAFELYRDTVVGKKESWREYATRMETWAMQYCDGIIACNDHRAKVMYEEYGAPFLPAVVRNVPSYQDYRPSEVLRNYVAERNPRIRRICLHQGSLTESRGMDVLIRSLAKLPPDVGMVFVGYGDHAYVARLNKIVEELGVADRFFMHPAVSYTELHALTCSADIGIIIYQNVCRNNYYCAPNKLYEYAGAGLPIAGADLPPIRDFLETYSCGECFAPDSPDELAAAITRLLADPKEYERKRQAALEAAKIECWEHESKRLLKLYESLLPCG